MNTKDESRKVVIGRPLSPGEVELLSRSAKFSLKRTNLWYKTQVGYTIIKPARGVKQQSAKKALDSKERPHGRFFGYRAPSRGVKSERAKKAPNQKERASARFANPVVIGSSGAVEVLCPIGPHSDPRLTTKVGKACGIAKADCVFVQCTQGHWAEYPCECFQ